MTIFKCVAGVLSNGTYVVVNTFTSVENISLKCSPSTDNEMENDFAGNSQESSAFWSLCCPTKSIVKVTGSLVSSNLLTQKDASLSSTAICAPCAALFTVELATTAAFAATFSLPAAKPSWLKQNCPGRPILNWPFPPM